MEDYRLPKTAKSVVHALVEAADLNPAEFQWSDEQPGGHFLISSIKHIPTGYRFSFTTTSGLHGVSMGAKWTPADGTGRSFEGAESRDHQLAICRRWLQVVKREHESPDLWAAVQDESRLIVGEVVAKDDKFTKAELAMLRQGLDEIKAHLVQQTSPTSPRGMSRSLLNFSGGSGDDYATCSTSFPTNPSR